MGPNAIHTGRERESIGVPSSSRLGQRNERETQEVPWELLAKLGAGEGSNIWTGRAQKWKSTGMASSWVATTQWEADNGSSAAMYGGNGGSATMATAKQWLPPEIMRVTSIYMVRGTHRSKRWRRRYCKATWRQEPRAARRAQRWQSHGVKEGWN